MSLLNGELVLHGVNIEKLARKAVDDYLRFKGAVLDYSMYDSALSYAVSEAWRDSGKFDPDRGWSASKFFYDRMFKRMASWYRQEVVNFRRVGFSAETTRTESLDRDDRARIVASVSVGPEILEMINVELLSPVSRSTIELVVKPGLEQGKTMVEIARERAIPRRDLTERMKRLRKELTEKCLAA